VWINFLNIQNETAQTKRSTNYKASYETKVTQAATHNGAYDKLYSPQRQLNTTESSKIN